MYTLCGLSQGILGNSAHEIGDLGRTMSHDARFGTIALIKQTKTPVKHP